MKRYTRREVIQKGGRLAAGAAMATSCCPLAACSAEGETAFRFPPGAMQPAGLDTLTLTVVYDNNAYKPGLAVDWGFACLVEGLGRTILFDTGRHDTFLMSNMAALGLDPARIDDIVISHKHFDHTGGLNILMARKVGKQVFMVKGINPGLNGKLAEYGAVLQTIDQPAVIARSVLSTGAMKRFVLSEQGMVVLTEQGAILVVGCAHPGIVEMVRRAVGMTGMPILLVVGGFHLLDSYTFAIEEIVEAFRALGVRYVAPTHCTGPEARKIFAAAYGSRCLDCGAGRTIGAADLV